MTAAPKNDEYGQKVGGFSMSEAEAAGSTTEVANESAQRQEQLKVEA